VLLRLSSCYPEGIKTLARVADGGGLVEILLNNPELFPSISPLHFQCGASSDRAVRLRPSAFLLITWHIHSGPLLRDSCVSPFVELGYFGNDDREEERKEIGSDMENDSDTRGRTQKPFDCWTCRQRTSSQVEMEIPMTTERSEVKKILALPDRSHNLDVGECNGILSRRNVASRRSHDVVYFLSCHQCQLCVSRGTFDPAGIEGSRQQPGAAKHAVSHHSGNSPTTEAETEHVKIPKSPSITKCLCRAQLKRRRRTLLLLPSAAAVLTFLLLTFVACRPCHGHDPELKDMDDEDGKFSISLYL
jgi:hypothetical protein